MPMSEAKNTAADILEMLLECVHNRGTAHEGYLLCNVYNWATDPAVGRTSREHEACDRLSRWAKRRLDQLGRYAERNDGKLFMR